MVSRYVQIYRFSPARIVFLSLITKRFCAKFSISLIGFLYRDPLAFLDSQDSRESLVLKEKR